MQDFGFEGEEKVQEDRLQKATCWIEMCTAASLHWNCFIFNQLIKPLSKCFKICFYHTLHLQRLITVQHCPSQVYLERKELCNFFP